MIYPNDNLGPALSIVFVLLMSFGLLWMLGQQIYYIVKAQLRAVRAQRSHDPNTILAEGMQVVSGKVRHAEDEEHAVRVEITQKAFEKENSGHYSHRWVEQSRTVKVAPFYLEHASGERILVEPTQEVFLVDDMDGVIFYDRNRRRRDRIAELTDGEQVFAEGVMRRESGLGGAGGGYREAPKVWALRAPPRGRLELSSHPLPMRFQRWRRFHIVVAVATLLTFIGFHLTLASFHERFFYGETATATFAQKYHYVSEGSEGSTTDHWVLQTRLPWGQLHEEDISRTDWSNFPSQAPKPPESIPVTVLHVDQELVQYGDRATFHWVAALLLFLGTLGLLGLFTHRKRRHTAWYEGKVTDSGKGRIEKKTGLDEKL